MEFRNPSQCLGPVAFDSRKSDVCTADDRVASQSRGTEFIACFESEKSR